MQIAPTGLDDLGADELREGLVSAELKPAGEAVKRGNYLVGVSEDDSVSDLAMATRIAAKALHQ
jgi:hypothetical protein